MPAVSAYPLPIRWLIRCHINALRNSCHLTASCPHWRSPRPRHSDRPCASCSSRRRRTARTGQCGSWPHQWPNGRLTMLVSSSPQDDALSIRLSCQVASQHTGVGQVARAVGAVVVLSHNSRRRFTLASYVSRCFHAQPFVLTRCAPSHTIAV